MADGEIKVRNKPNKYFNSLNQQSHSLRKRLAPKLKRANDIYITNKSDFKVCKPLHFLSLQYEEPSYIYIYKLYVLMVLSLHLNSTVRVLLNSSKIQLRLNLT